MTITFLDNYQSSWAETWCILNGQNVLYHSLLSHSYTLYFIQYLPCRRILTFILIRLRANRCSTVILHFPSVKMNLWFFSHFLPLREQSSICTQEIAWDKICITFLQISPLPIPLWMTKSREWEWEELGEDSVDLNLLNLLTRQIAVVQKQLHTCT